MLVTTKVAGFQEIPALQQSKSSTCLAGAVGSGGGTRQQLSRHLGIKSQGTNRSSFLQDQFPHL